MSSFQFSSQSNQYPMLLWLTITAFFSSGNKIINYIVSSTWDSFSYLLSRNRNIGCLLGTMLLEHFIHIISWQPQWAIQWGRDVIIIFLGRVDSLEKTQCWEGLGAGGEGDDRGWDGWMALPTRWTWVWVNSKSWWWTGRPGVLRFMGSQSRTRLSDWTDPNQRGGRGSQCLSDLP